MVRAQELCESRGGRRSWAPVPNKPTVSMDVKQHSTKVHGSGCTATTAVVKEERESIGSLSGTDGNIALAADCRSLFFTLEFFFRQELP